MELHQSQAPVKFLFIPYMALTEEATACLRQHPEVVVIAQSVHPNRLGELRGLVHQMMVQGLEILLSSSSSIRKTTWKICRSKQQPTWAPSSSTVSATVF